MGSLHAIEAYARALSFQLKKGDILLFNGEMGTGKTTFIRALSRYLGVQNEVTSPTFTTVHVYQASLPLYHLDLYRVERLEDLFTLDIELYFQKTDALVLIEWAEKLEDLTPKNYLSLSFSYALKPDERILEVLPVGDTYTPRFQKQTL